MLWRSLCVTEYHRLRFICTIRIDTPGVIQRVSRLFHGHPSLIEGFNTFLPVGYRIDVSVDPLDPNAITVTTPLGTTTQSTNTSLTPVPGSSRQSRNVPGLPPPQPPSSQPSLLSQSTMYQGSPVPPVTNAVGGGGGAPDSRSMTPHAYRLVYSPGLPSQNPQMTAAEHLNNLNSSGNKAVQVEKKQPEEFNHAIQYLNKIKARYAEEPNTYKQFLDILQTYHKEQKHSNDVGFHVSFVA